MKLGRSPIPVTIATSGHLIPNSGTIFPSSYIVSRKKLYSAMLKIHKGTINMHEKIALKKSDNKYQTLKSLIYCAH